MYKRSRNREKGGAMIESAFIFTVLFFLLIGIFDFGQFLFVHQALVERARSAVRWAIVNNPDDSTAIKNKVLYDQAVLDTSRTYTGYFGLTASNVVVSRTGVGTNDNRLTVQIVNFPYEMLSPLLVGRYTGPAIRESAALAIFQ